jgi:alpha-glucosidase
VEAILGTVKFWLELGVDGYRLDTANYYFHDKQLRDNPGRGQPKGNDPAVNDVNPYGWQYHKFDKTQPENLGFLKQLRALLDQYPNTTMVGEIGDDDGLTVMAEYTSGTDKLHMAYSFDLLGPDSSSTYLHDLMTRFAEKNATGWPSWALSNHDVVRVGSRWGGESADVRKLRVAAAFQMCLRGSPCLYQGDELGLPEAQVAYEDLQDPYGITMWPEFKGRDGCRTPMPWDGKAADMGFGSGTQKPWLPLTEAYRRLAVSEQDKDPQSLLNFYRGLLAWRKGQDVLLHGDQALLPAHKQVMAFVREHEGKKVLCAFNFSDSTATMDLPAEFKSASALHVPGLSGGSVAGDTIKLETYGALLLFI